MADFRKAKYSGSLNLAPECGPVLIELDTEAKTATASLEDPASQYTLAGGGGGMETATVGITFGESASGEISALINNESIQEFPADFPRGYMVISLSSNFVPADQVETIKGTIWSTNFTYMSPSPTVAVTGDITYNSTYGLFVISGDGTITVS